MIKILKIAGYLIGSLVLLFIIGFLVLVIFVSPDRFKPLITQQIKTHTGRQLTIDGHLSWTFYPYLGVKVGHASLSNPAGFKQSMFVEISNATMGVKLVPLLKGVIVSQNISLKGLKLTLIKTENGKNNWTFTQPVLMDQRPKNEPSVKSLGEKSMPLGITISGLDITDAKINWIDEQTHQTAVIDDFTLHSSKINFTEPFPVTAEFDFNIKNPQTKGHVNLKSSVAFSLDKQIYSFRNVDVKAEIKQGTTKLKPHVTGDISADLEKENLQWTHFNADISNLKLTGEIKVNNLLSDPFASGQLTLHPFDLKTFLKSTGQENENIQEAKNVDGNIDFTASAKNIKVNGNFKLEQLKIAKITVAKTNIKMHYLNGIVDFTPITGKLYEGNLDAQANINLNLPQPQINMQGKLSNIQFESLQKDLQTSNQKFKIKGLVNIDFNIITSGKDDQAITNNLSGTSHLHFANGVIEGIDIGYMIDSAYVLITQKGSNPINTNQTAFGNLSATAVISNGVVNCDDFLLRSPRFDTNGNGSINLVKQTINFSLNTTVKQTNVNVVKDFSGLIIPINITGSLSDPSINLDTGELLKGIAQNQLQQRRDQIEQKLKDNIPEQAGKLLQNLLGR